MFDFRGQSVYAFFLPFIYLHSGSNSKSPTRISKRGNISNNNNTSFTSSSSSSSSTPAVTTLFSKANSTTVAEEAKRLLAPVRQSARIASLTLEKVCDVRLCILLGRRGRSVPSYISCGEGEELLFALINLWEGGRGCLSLCIFVGLRIANCGCVVVGCCRHYK